MVLAQPDAKHATLVGKYLLIHHVSDDLRVAYRLSIRTSLNIAECVETELNFLRHQFRLTNK